MSGDFLPDTKTGATKSGKDTAYSEDHYTGPRGTGIRGAKATSLKLSHTFRRISNYVHGRTRFVISVIAIGWLAVRGMVNNVLAKE